MGKILVVDDEREIVDFVTKILEKRGHEVLGLTDARQSKTLFGLFVPDVCILDFQMPFVTGAELLDGFKQIDPMVEVIFLTGQEETLLAVELMKRGAIDYLLKPVVRNQLHISVLRALEHRRLVQENAAYKMHLEMLVAEKTEALDAALRSLSKLHAATLQTLALALDFRDQGTSGHSRRVSNLTTGIARELGISGEALVQIEHGALLHDIGKLRVPDSILWKPGKLTDSEWLTMRRHAEYGYEFVRDIEFLKGASEIVYSHHEKFGGSGYPRGLKGTRIPLGARLFAIVDAVDALIYERPYHKAITFQQAAEEIRRGAGSHFDPALIEPTLRYLEQNCPKLLEPTPEQGTSKVIGE
jgi:putative nucleotidyltransferase with HDIG domain